ncbi:hypothetical protein [Mycobacterium sp. AZCC_0083]|uniref:hypothetical protein n=1 Tax=Mycobacterium sp. AZCC_0083 TaxID=2735882 RepID=UPI00160EF88B|nr:hypothetical protein [Mycobacterium sp. AZCC_0083]MBB5167176.1 hypothetical protein [Mycobacterium sp. AZCC_0083]
MSAILRDVIWDDLDIDYLLTQSYKDFHAKGLDYVCLHRDAGLTLKAYFFAEGMDSQKAGEVVNPHDHRYNFVTQCMSGVIENQWYRTPPCWDPMSDDPIADECGEVYETHLWYTPLNGGVGFTKDGGWILQRYKTYQFAPGQQYWMSAPEIHTIRVVKPETCIVIAQFEDVVPLDQPTVTFTKSKLPPSLEGLYGTFTADQLVKRIGLLRELQEQL